MRPKRLDGSGTPTSPSRVISNTPSSFVEPNRFFVARRMRCAWYRSPSNCSTQSTRCSSTRGPATAPSFVTWPTRTVATPFSFATRSSREAASRTCATEPGAEPSSPAWSVCTESITQTVGRCGLERRADDVELRLGEDRDVVGAAEALGAKAHLRDGLLAGDEQRAAARSARRRRGR